MTSRRLYDFDPMQGRRTPRQLLRAKVLTTTKALVDIYGLKPTETPNMFYADGKPFAQLEVTQAGRVTITIETKLSTRKARKRG